MSGQYSDDRFHSYVDKLYELDENRTVICFESLFTVQMLDEIYH